MQHAVKKYSAAVHTHSLTVGTRGDATHRDVFRKSVATDRLSAPGHLVVVLRRFVECRFSDTDQERPFCRSVSAVCLQKVYPLHNDT